MAKIVMYAGKIPLNASVWYDPKRKLLEFEIGTYENFRFTEAPDPTQTGELVNSDDLNFIARRCTYILQEQHDDAYALAAYERWDMHKVMPQAMFNTLLRVGIEAMKSGQTHPQAVDAMEVTLELMKAGS